MKIIALLAVLAAACLLATPYFYLAPVPGLGVLFLFCLNRNPALGIYLFVIASLLSTIFADYPDTAMLVLILSQGAIYFALRDSASSDEAESSAATLVRAG